jgi:hypothetical protein
MLVPDIALFPLELSLRDYLLRALEVLEVSLKGSSEQLVLSNEEHAQPQQFNLCDPTTPSAQVQAQTPAPMVGSIGTPASLKVRRTSMVKAMVFEEAVRASQAPHGVGEPFSLLFALKLLSNKTRTLSGVVW